MGPCAAACARSYFSECSAVPWKTELNPSTGGLLPVVFQSLVQRVFGPSFGLSGVLVMECKPSFSNRIVLITVTFI